MQIARGIRRAKFLLYRNLKWKNKLLTLRYLETKVKSAENFLIPNIELKKLLIMNEEQFSWKNFPAFLLKEVKEVRELKENRNLVLQYLMLGWKLSHEQIAEFDEVSLNVCKEYFPSSNVEKWEPMMKFVLLKSQVDRV